VAVTAKRLATTHQPLATRMGEAVADFRFTGCSAATAEKAKLCMLDVLASAFTSSELPWSRQAVALATRGSGGAKHAASIVGERVGVSQLDAAFANGVLGHGLVRDDMHVGSVSHLGTVIVPTLLSLAAQSRASGKDLIAAAVAGYEVGGKVGRMILDVEVSKIFRPTGITGPIAAAAAGARLLGLDAARTTTALAIAANTAAGYNEWAATGGSEMFFHTGFAARSAVSAVLLAAEGAYASTTAIDGEAGLLAAFHKDLQPNVPDLFADSLEILAVFFKPVPACNFAQSAAQAALAIAKRQRVRADDIARVGVRVTRAAALYPGCNVSGPFEHILQAKMSIHYNVAAALVNGDFEERNYVPAENPQVLKLAARTTLEVDAELTSAFPARQGAEVIVHTRAGDTWRERMGDVVPTDAAGVRQRFAAASAAVLGAPAGARLGELIDALERCPDARRLNRAVAKRRPATKRKSAAKRGGTRAKRSKLTSRRP
jgi:2-methylcitrate dehydratase PrpD